MKFKVSGHAFSIANLLKCFMAEASRHCPGCLSSEPKTSSRRCCWEAGPGGRESASHQKKHHIRYVRVLALLAIDLRGISWHLGSGRRREGVSNPSRYLMSAVKKMSVGLGFHLRVGGKLNQASASFQPCVLQVLSRPGLESQTWNLAGQDYMWIFISHSRLQNVGFVLSACTSTFRLQTYLQSCIFCGRASLWRWQCLLVLPVPKQCAPCHLRGPPCQPVKLINVADTSLKRGHGHV